MMWLVLLAGLLSVGGPAGELLEVVEGVVGGGAGDAPAPGPAPPILPETGAVLPATAAIAGMVLTTLIAAGTKHVNRDNILEHDTRRQMYEYIWETGAVHLRKIATALDLSTTNATWHLDKLVKAGMIGELKANGYRMYYPRGGGKLLRDQCLVAAQIQSDNAKAVVDYVADHPGSHQRQIARALDVNHGTARWHLSRLCEAGILASRDEGRQTVYRLTDHAEHVLAEMPPLEMFGEPQTA